MRTLLHIGMQKAGSTALQQALFHSRAALSAHGVLYPQSPQARHFNHKLMLSGLFDWRGSRTGRLSPDKLPPSRTGMSERFFADMRRTIAEERPSALVLSSELMFRVLPKDAVRRLPDLLEGLAEDLTVVVYLRPPAEHYVSRLQQQLKASHRVVQPKSPGYRDVLAQYAKIFGRTRLSANPFDRALLADGDIVADFVARYLAPFGLSRADLETPPRTNETISAELMDVSRRYRLAFHPDDADRFTTDSSTLVAALARADAAVGAPRPQLRPGIANLLDHRSELPWLRHHHGIVFPNVDYADLKDGQRPDRLERELALEEIVEIDRDRQRAILAELRASDWASGSRRAWIDGLLADSA